MNTTGLGVVTEGVCLSPGEAGQERLGALHGLVADMLETTHAIRCLRDPTRGGVSSSLNEIAAQSQVGILIDEQSILIAKKCVAPTPDR